MGNGSGRSGSHIPTGTVVDAMVRKYGWKSLECLPYWSNTYGFPENGSFSTYKLKLLRQELEEKEKKLRKKNKIKTSDLEQAEKNKECFNLWMKEAETRESKRMQKNMSLLKMNSTNEVQAKKA